VILMCAAIGVLLMSMSQLLRPEKLYFIVDVTLIFAAAGVLLMSME